MTNKAKQFLDQLEKDLSNMPHGWPEETEAILFPDDGPDKLKLLIALARHAAALAEGQCYCSSGTPCNWCEETVEAYYTTVESIGE